MSDTATGTGPMPPGTITTVGQGIHALTAGAQVLASAVLSGKPAMILASLTEELQRRLSETRALAVAEESRLLPGIEQAQRHLESAAGKIEGEAGRWKINPDTQALVAALRELRETA